MVDFPVNIIYSLVDKVTSTVGSVKASLNSLDKAASDSGKSFNAMEEAMQTASGVLMRDFVNSLTSGIAESMRFGAQLQSLQSSFNVLSSSSGSAKLSLDELRNATRGTVSDVDLLTAANKAMSLGLPTEELDEMFGAAMKLGRVMGIDTLSAVDSLATGVGRQSKMILDNLGIVFQAEEAYEWYATQVGKATSALDENEKKLAWQKYAIEQVTVRAKNFGDITDENITSQEAWGASIKNLQASIGEALGPLSQFVGAFESMIPLISSVALSVLPQLIRSHKNLALAVGGVTAAVGAAFTILAVVPSELRPVASAISIFIGVVVAATVAVAAFYGVVSWGAAVPAIIAGVGVAIAGVAGALGFLDSATEATITANGELGASFGALESIISDYESKINDLSMSYGELVASEEAAFKTSIEELKKYYTDKYGTTQTNLTSIQSEINKHYDGLIDSARRAYDLELELAVNHFKMLFGEAEAGLGVVEEYVNDYFNRQIDLINDGYKTELEDAKSYFNSLWGVTSDELGELEDYVRSHYDKELSMMEQSHSDQLSELNAYYNALVDAAKGKVDELKESNDKEMRDLEILYLTKKKLVEDESRNPRSGEVQTGSLAYMTGMAELEEWYAKQKAELSDKHKLSELKAENEFASEKTDILQEQAERELELREQQNSELASLQEMQQRDLEEALNRQVEATRNRDSALVELEVERQSRLEEARQMQLEAESDFNSELRSIEEQRTADLEFAYSEVERLTREHHDKLLEMEHTYLTELVALKHKEASAISDLEYSESKKYLDNYKPEAHLFPWLLDESEYPEEAPQWTRGEPIETWYRGEPPAATIVRELDTSFISSTESLFKKVIERFDNIPRMAEGGLVSKPTLALVGEAGPEVVLPVNRFNNRAGDVYNISVPIHVQGSVDERVLRLMEKRLGSVLVEATSSGGKTKRIRRGGIF